MRRIAEYTIILTLAINLIPALALAGTAGREKNRDVTTVFNSSAFYLQPNICYEIETLNLSPGADTVLHVQEFGSGAYVFIES